jgi:hypothetical protein
MTILQIVNRVLRRLREDAVTSLVETDYSRLIVDFLHDTHQECIERHDWSAMEHVVDVPVDAAQRVLDLSQNETDGGDVSDSSRVPKNDSSLLFDECGLAQAWLFDDSSENDGDQLRMVSTQQMERLYQLDRDYSGEDPTCFSLTMHPSRDGLQMTLWPPAASACHIRLRLWTPEDEVDETTDAARTLLVPSRPLVLGTLMLALNERGEELGEPGNKAEQRYYDAISGAIEQDVGRRAQTNRYEARRE